MIAFYTDEGVAMPPINQPLLKDWITQVAELRSRRIGVISYQFCLDERILAVNREFLQHDYYTDIITFDECRGDKLNGDLLISLETVASNAEGLGVAFLDELSRVIIHGILHLIGLGDKTPEEELAMRKAEDEALALLSQLRAERGLV